MANRPAIGVKDLVYALLTESSDVAGGTAVYGTVKALAGLGKITVNPNGNAAVLYGDDQAQHVANSIGKIDLSIDLADISPSAYAEILGHTYAAGGVLEKVEDISPYVAVGFKRTHTGSSVETYNWLYKVKFMQPDTSAETKKESISFQSQSLRAIAVPLISSGVWRLQLRTDDENASSSVIAAFFSTVILSASPDLGALTLSSATGDASDKKIILTFAKAGGGTTKIANPSADNITVVLDSNHSIVVPTSYVAGTASETPTVTLTFSSLTEAAHTIVVTAGLKDLNGVSCVVKSVACTPEA